MSSQKKQIETLFTKQLSSLEALFFAEDIKASCEYLSIANVLNISVAHAQIQFKFSRKWIAEIYIRKFYPCKKRSWSYLLQSINLKRFELFMTRNMDLESGLRVFIAYTRFTQALAVCHWRSWPDIDCETFKKLLSPAHRSITLSQLAKMNLLSIYELWGKQKFNFTPPNVIIKYFQLHS